MNSARAYEVRPDQAAWGKLNSVEATRWRRLPGVKCPICGAWAATGVIYPFVDRSVFERVPLADAPEPVPFEQFSRLATDIQPLLGSRRPAQPGAELGPLRGKANGRFGDFAWVNPWTPLLRQSVWLALKEAGVPVNGVRAELDFGALGEEAFVELEALPTARLTKALVPERCAICGRLPIRKPDNITITAPTFDSSQPLQRIAEIPTVLVANRPFVNFVQERRLRDVVLVPIAVSE